jgi:flagellar basal body-associated protein FliL
MAEVKEKSAGLGEDADVAPTAAPTAKFRLPAWLPKVAILVGLAAAAFGVALFVVRPMLPVASGEAKPKPPEKFGRVLALEPVVVNLAQSEGRRYLKATVHLEIGEEEKLAKDVEARKPQIQDLLVATFSRKTLSDATAPEAILGRERVRRVFITEFVVQ